MLTIIENLLNNLKIKLIGVQNEHPIFDHLSRLIIIFCLFRHRLSNPDQRVKPLYS